MSDQQSNQLAVLEQPTDGSLKVFSSKEQFELATRMAMALAKSKMIPEAYQGSAENVLVALEMANRIGTSPLMVMQNLHIIKGKPSFGSAFIIGLLNSCGRFSPQRWITPKSTEPADPKYSCRAVAKDLDTGDTLEGTLITWQMVQQEGWLNKDGSKWKTMPEQMFRYRASAFFGRLYAPDLVMGMQTIEEVRDVRIEDVLTADLEAEISAKMDKAKTEEDFEMIAETYEEYKDTKQYRKMLQYFRQKNIR